MASYNFDLFTTWRYVIRFLPLPCHFEESDPLSAHKLVLSQSPSAYNPVQWCYSPTGSWPKERPPPVSEASANFCG